MGGGGGCKTPLLSQNITRLAHTSLMVENLVC